MNSTDNNDVIDLNDSFEQDSVSNINNDSIETTSDSEDNQDFTIDLSIKIEGSIKEATDNLVDLDLDPVNKATDSVNSPEDSTSQNPTKKKSKAGLIIGLSFLAIFLAAAVYYGLGVYRFWNVFQMNTYINDTDVSGKTPAEVSEELLYENKIITVKGKDGICEELSLDDMGYEETPETAYEELKDQQTPWLWFKYHFEETHFNDEAGITVERSDIKDALEKTAFFENVKPSVNAEIKKDPSGFYSVVKEVYGNELYLDKAVELIKEKLTAKIYEVDLEEGDCYKKPEITSENEDLVYISTKLKSIYDSVITIDLNGGVTEKLDKHWLKNVICLNEEYFIYADESKVREYAEYLKKTFDTLFKKRSFTSSAYGVISVGTNNDTLGFDMNLEETYQLILAAVTSGVSQTIAPAWNSIGITRNSNGDIGNSYIEIDITGQHLWFYNEGNLIVSTDIISGLSTVPERNTPQGVFTVFERAQNINLQGTMGDETWDEHVDYWIGIIEGIGIHDASWQTGGFGGNLYTWRGSHGCINVPLEKAAEIYSNSQIGLPVVIY